MIVAYMRALVIAFLLLSVLSILVATNVYSQGVGIKKISFYVETDPSTNMSYVVTVVELTEYINSGVVSVPIINDVEYVYPLKAYGSSEAQNFSVTYNESTRSFEILVYNTSVINIEYIAYGLFYESGFESYSADIDLVYEGISNVYMEVKMPSEYTVMVITAGEYSVGVEDGKRVVKLYTPDTYIVVASRTEEPTIPTAPPTTTQPTTPTTATGPGASTSSSAPSNTTTPTPVSPLNYLALTGVLLAIIAIVAAVLFIRRRGGGVEVEHVSPTDIFSDDINREIILTIGSEGERGIQQNRLVNVLGKPKSTISRKLRRLRELGYITIERAGRSNIIRLTKKGYEAYKKLKSGGETSG